MNQYQLLKSRRFIPLFLTQFLGAFNDNVYKNALVILIIFQGSTLYGLDSNILVTLSAGIFILPYFLFSATAGQFADKYEKAMLIRWVKFLEVIIMSAAIIGFYQKNILFLMILLFLMGAQSTLFGPLKYGILPQHLQENELMGGNGMMSMGTFLAILLGTILGGVLVSIEFYGPMIVAVIVVILAFLGLLTSFFIPTAPAAEETLQIHWNIATQTWQTMKYALENRSVFIAILAISWFWLVGATYLSQVPAYTKDVLNGNNQVVTLLLTMFSVGIGMGSILCEKLSRGRIELGLVPLGAIGITLFSIDIYFASQHFPQVVTLMGASDLLKIPSSWRILLDLSLIGLFGGIYIVPLNAMIQHRSDPQHRARVIAANNILNALLMVGSAIGTILLLKLGFSIPTIFLWLGLCNMMMTLSLFLFLPEFIEHFIKWLRLVK